MIQTDYGHFETAHRWCGWWSSVVANTETGWPAVPLHERPFMKELCKNKVRSKRKSMKVNLQNPKNEKN